MKFKKTHSARSNGWKDLGIGFFVVLQVTCAAAWELGPTASYVNAGERLNINGRFVHLKTGGVGLRASESLFSQNLAVDVSALYGATGSANATFSGADVSGPAHLSSYKANLTLYWSPDSHATPYVRVGHVRQRGDTNFTGSRNGSPVRGSTQLELDSSEAAVGIRWVASDALTLFGEAGQHDWRLNSDAAGTVGALRARTRIQADHKDPFFRVGATLHRANWRGTVSLGQYRMTADNQTQTRSIDASLMYAF